MKLCEAANIGSNGMDIKEFTDDTYITIPLFLKFMRSKKISQFVFNLNNLN